LGSTLNARFGAPPLAIDFPSRPTSFVLSSVKEPAAACTSATAVRVHT